MATVISLLAWPERPAAVACQHTLHKLCIVQVRRYVVNSRGDTVCCAICHRALCQTVSSECILLQLMMFCVSGVCYDNADGCCCCLFCCCISCCFCCFHCVCSAEKCSYGMLDGYRGLQSSRQEYHQERFVGRLTLSVGRLTLFFLTKMKISPETCSARVTLMTGKQSMY